MTRTDSIHNASRPQSGDGCVNIHSDATPEQLEAFQKWRDSSHKPPPSTAVLVTGAIAVSVLVLIGMVGCWAIVQGALVVFRAV